MSYFAAALLALVAAEIMMGGLKLSSSSSRSDRLAEPADVRRESALQAAEAADLCTIVIFIGAIVLDGPFLRLG